VLRPALPLVLASLACGCAATLPHSGPAAPGDYRQTLEGGPEDGRLYLVHLPPSYDGHADLPVVIALHGAFASAARMRDISGFDAVADEKGFVVLYPEAVGGILGLGRLWNSGHLHTRQWEEGIDDVAFVLRVLEDARARLALDPARVTVAGYSNGGMMALRLAAERPDVFAAAASVGGTTGGLPNDAEPLWTPPAPSRPVPVLLIHGSADTKVPYHGGEPDRRRNGFTCMSHAESCAWWARANGVEGPPAESVEREGRLLRLKWGQDALVEGVTLVDWGHVWPGPASIREGAPFEGFDAARECWGFFAR
jgi:polyhydroxybutyrate depolymerase